MKDFIRIATTLFASTLVFSTMSRAQGALDTPQRATLVKNYMEKAVLSLDGVNGIGITGCNSRTGERFQSGQPFVHCVSISTDSPEGYALVSHLYPRGININGVYITVEQIGKIVPQPRVTGSN